MAIMMVRTAMSRRATVRKRKKENQRMGESLEGTFGLMEVS